MVMHTTMIHEEENYRSLCKAPEYRNWKQDGNIEILSDKNTCELVWPAPNMMLAIMLDLVELGENPSQGGTKISFVH